jgi:hypothetical protein
MILLDEQVAWVWVGELRMVPGLEEQIAGEVVDEFAGFASDMGVGRIVVVGSRSGIAGCM